MNTEGILIILSGFSGAGKGTIMKELMSRHAADYALSISATSRKPRVGEEDGVHYFFKTREEFQQMIAAGELLEYAEYVGNYYGTPKAYVMDQLKQGRNVILEIEMQGGQKVKAAYPETRMIFVTTPSAEILKDRLVGRGTETAEVIADRLHRAYEESDGIGQYQYLLVNDDLDTAVETLHQLIMNDKNGNSSLNEEFLVTKNTEFIKTMRKELSGFAKGDH